MRTSPIATACLFTLLAAPAQAQMPDEPVAAEASRCQSPYLFVAGGDPDKERLPLESTVADVGIAGAIARVRISQTFVNGGATPIEAVYVFPASTRAAVHRMQMRIGERAIEAQIDRKQKAAATYEKAKQEGKRGALLEQQRANVFSMKVANVMPGDRIQVVLEYSELLVPEDAVYEFVYPAVVGPRYGGGTDAVNDRFVRTPYLGEGKPESYGFDVRVHLEAGLPIQEVSSPSHEIVVDRPSPDAADVRLAGKGGGNRDYVLRYRLAGDRIQTGLMLAPPATADGEGFFALMMQPPRRPAEGDMPPREYVFLVDVSGSMHGFPLETAKQVLGRLLETLRPQDSFNIVLFASSSRVLAPEGSLPATAENRQAALQLIGREDGGGGTELLAGLERAYGLPRARPGLSRSVVVVTDGYVGVEAQVYRFVRERLGETNLFAFGIGTSVNRALIEGMARAGASEPFVVLSAKQAEAQASRFRAYIDRPLVTSVRVAMHGFDAYEVAPAQLPDLMAERPLVLLGKYRGPAQGRIEVTGVTGQGAFRREVKVGQDAVRPEAAPLRWLWARKQAEWLEDEMLLRSTDELKEELTRLGLRYSLLTSTTSFVAVDRVVANSTGQLHTSEQPLPLPDGVSNRALGASVALSRTAMPPGDPILTVAAAPDARLVTAFFPFGLVKDLAYDPWSERWQTRFLVPIDVPDGIYDVPVSIQHRDGSTEMVTAQYRIDSSAPDFDLEVVPVEGGVNIVVRSNDQLRRVVVALVAKPRLRVELGDAGDHRLFSGFLALPAGTHRLRVVVADQARNENEDLFTAEVK